MTLSPPADTTLRPPETHWTEVRGICRRICLLRAQGLGGQARRVEDAELPEALARAAAAAGAEDGARARAVMAEERERVASAAVLAEILAPMLSGRLHAAAPARAPSPEAPVARAPGGARGIADFIDEMLARERAGPP